MVLNFYVHQLVNYFCFWDESSRISQYWVDGWPSYRFCLDGTLHLGPAGCRATKRSNTFSQFLFHLFQHGCFDVMIWARTTSLKCVLRKRNDWLHDLQQCGPAPFDQEMFDYRLNFCSHHDTKRGKRCPISPLVSNENLSTDFYGSWSWCSISSESFSNKISDMCSAAGVMLCTARTRSMKNRTTSFAVTAMRLINIVSYDPNFETTLGVTLYKELAEVS